MLKYLLQKSTRQHAKGSAAEQKSVIRLDNARLFREVRDERTKASEEHAIRDVVETVDKVLYLMWMPLELFNHLFIKGSK